MFISVIDFSKLPASVQEAVADLELATKQCDAFHFNICLSYGSRAEIVNACNHIVNDVVSVIRQEDSEQTGKMSELKHQESDSSNSTRTIPHITEDIFERYLASNEHHMTSNEQNKLFSNPDSYCISDPDLLIRTSGEFRISNFLLWQVSCICMHIYCIFSLLTFSTCSIIQQLAYTELFFIPQLWPEITQYDLRSILIQYNDRQRRYGK